MKSRILLAAVLVAGAFVFAGAEKASAFTLLGGSCGCDAAPACCEPVSCCRPKRCHNLFNRCCKPKCETSCCDAAPSCAAAAPTCAAAAPTCGCEAAPSCGCDDGCNKCCKQKRCRQPRCCREPRCRKSRCCEASCGCGAAPSCGCGG